MEEEYKIFFFWTRESPRSVQIKSIIEKSPYSNVISLACADDPNVRNYLLYGKYPQASVPIFMTVQNGLVEFYQIKDVRKMIKVMNLSSYLLEHLQPEDLINEPSVAQSSATNLSLSSHVSEDN